MNYDLRDINLSNLDLRRTTFSNIICSDANDSTRSISFLGSIVDRWSFRTLGYCGDVAAVRYIKRLNCVIATDRNKIIFINATTLEVSKFYSIESDYAQSIALSPDETKLLCTGLNGEIKEWDLDSNSLTVNYRITDRKLHHIEYLSNDSALFVTRNKEICIIDLKLQTHRILFYANANKITLCGDNTLLVISRNREVIHYDLGSKKIVNEYSSEGKGGSYITNAVFTKNRNLLIGSTKDGYIFEWAVHNRDPHRAYQLDDDVNTFFLPSSEECIYCLCENEGLVLINRANSSIEKIGFPCRGRWNDMNADFQNHIIYMADLEGRVASYSEQTKQMKLIRNKTHSYTIPYLNIRGCDFRNLHPESKLDTNTIKDLITNGAIFE